MPQRKGHLNANSSFWRLHHILAGWVDYDCTGTGTGTGTGGVLHIGIRDLYGRIGKMVKALLLTLFTTRIAHLCRLVNS